MNSSSRSVSVTARASIITQISWRPATTVASNTTQSPRFWISVAALFPVLVSCLVTIALLHSFRVDRVVRKDEFNVSILTLHLSHLNLPPACKLRVNDDISASGSDDKR